MKTQHTPVPWKVGEDQNDGRFIYQFDPATKRSQIIGVMQFVDDLVNGKYVLFEEVGKANAEFIVRAVNSHDALLEAALNAGNCITDMFEQMERGNWVDDHSHDVRLNVHMQRLIPAVKELMQAIAQAEGKP